MRTATFTILGALGMACAHPQPAEPTTAQAPRTAPAEPAEIETQSAALSDSRSGDPNLGNLQISDAPAAPRAEVANPESGKAAADAQPRAIEPAAPTVATTPPGSALAPKAPAPASREEAELRERIQRSLLSDASLSFTAKRVHVEIERGRVTLLGEVRTAREKSEVEDVVQKVSGVRRVENRLAVIDQPAATARH